MKKIFIIAAVAMFIASSGLAAEELPQVNLKFSPDIGKAQCASQPGKDVTLAWQGVSDTRESKGVGTVKVRSKEEAEVGLAGGIDSTFGEAIKTLFKNCGFNVEGADADGVKVSVDVTEFFAGSKKGFFTGETEAKGSIVVHLMKSGSSFNFNFGATRSDKGLRKKNIKRLEGVLNGLFEELVTQIGDSSQLFEEIKKLANR